MHRKTMPLQASKLTKAATIAVLLMTWWLFYFGGYPGSLKNKLPSEPKRASGPAQLRLQSCYPAHPAGPTVTVELRELECCN